MIRFGIKTISLKFHSQQENKVDPPSPQTGQPDIKVDAHTACRLVDWGLWKGLWGLVGLLSLVLAHSPLTLLGHLGALGWSVPCGPWGLRSWCGSSPAQLWVESRPGLQALAVTPGAAACSKVQGGTRPSSLRKDAGGFFQGKRPFVSLPWQVAGRLCSLVPPG